MNLPTGGASGAAPQPFQPLQSPLGTSFIRLSTAEVFLIVFSLIFVIWLIYTAVAAYHWFRFGHRSAIGVPALLVHVFVSGFLFLLAGSAFLGT